MKKVIERFTVDVNDVRYQTLIKSKVGDTAREFHINLSERGIPYKLESDCIANVRIRKPDNTYVHGACTIDYDNSVIKYEVSHQATARMGICDCELDVYGANGNLVSTPRFKLAVYDQVFPDDLIESRDEFSALTDALSKLANIRVDVSKEGKTTTLTVTNKDGVSQTVYILDGEDGQGGGGGSSYDDTEIRGEITELGGRVDELENAPPSKHFIDYGSAVNAEAIMGIALSGTIVGVTDMEAYEYAWMSHVDMSTYQLVFDNAKSLYKLHLGNNEWSKESKTAGGGVDVQVNGISIVDNGIANIPIIDTSNKLGLAKVDSSYGITNYGTDGRIRISPATNDNITSRHKYRPIVPDNIDFAVKAALTDGKGDSYTETEKQNARNRLGVTPYDDTDIRGLYNSLSGRVTTLEESGGGGSGGSVDVQINGTSITSGGVANIPIAQIDGAKGPLGVVGVKSQGNSGGITIDSDGYIRLYGASDSQIASRTSANFSFIPKQIDHVVKTALCDGVGPAYTETEKANARSRFGIGWEVIFDQIFEEEVGITAFIALTKKYKRYIGIAIANASGSASAGASYFSMCKGATQAGSLSVNVASSNKGGVGYLDIEHGFGLRAYSGATIGNTAQVGSETFAPENYEDFTHFRIYTNSSQKIPVGARYILLGSM